jgi:spore germination protein KC/spore germination protein
VNPEAFQKLQKLEEEVIKGEVEAALKKSRELNADIFGFGDIIYEHYPKKWEVIEKDWNKKLKNIQIDISVDAKLRRSGRIGKPIMSKD